MSKDADIANARNFARTCWEGAVGTGAGIETGTYSVNNSTLICAADSKLTNRCHDDVLVLVLVKYFLTIV